MSYAGTARDKRTGGDKMNPEKYFSVENGRDIMLGKLYDLKAAIDFAEENAGAKEIFAYTQDEELIGCVWSREME